MSQLKTNFKLPTSILGVTSGAREIIPVRVKDIILDESHPEYVKYGSVDSIGVIKYSLIDRKIDSSETTTLPAAFPLSTHSNTLPLKNEIVLLIKGPKRDFNFEKVDYYIPSLAIFNDINYIPSIDDNDGTETEPGYEFKEDDSIRPLHPYNGDTILQGRNGQSIRMTGAKALKNTFTDSTNLNKPLTIITNGHVATERDELYIEDINKDSSSIYLTSNHTIPLNQSREKYNSISTKPVKANVFKGSQIILNSGRLFFNSTTDDISFSSNKLYSVTAENISLDALTDIGFDAKKIYLGEKARFELLEPIILGTQLEIFLQKLLNVLVSTGNAMANARTIDQKIIPTLNLQGKALEEITKQLLNQINLLKSKKVFTE